MDDKKFLNLFRNLQSVMRCPSCGATYEMSETQFMGSKDGYFLLSMNCSRCSLPVWVNVFAGEKRQNFLGDLTVNDLSLTSQGPITTDEVLDFSTFIRKFDGNFKKILK